MANPAKKLRSESSPKASMHRKLPPHPKIVPPSEWLAHRRKLLRHEKELTKHHDRVNAERRRLPMVRIEKEYVFEGPEKNCVSAIFALISRAPLPKLDAYKTRRGWTHPWVSSFGSDFNYDFHVTLDENIAPVEYDYRNKAGMLARKVPNPVEGEVHGLSVFFRLGQEVFHTYSAYARGVENLTNAYSLLDTTPYGRQQDFEDSPPGWPQQPTYG